jgi:hypothetical protein
VFRLGRRERSRAGRHGGCSILAVRLCFEIGTASQAGAVLPVSKLGGAYCVPDQLSYVEGNGDISPLR